MKRTESERIDLEIRKYNYSTALCIGWAIGVLMGVWFTKAFL